MNMTGEVWPFKREIFLVTYRPVVIPIGQVVKGVPLSLQIPGRDIDLKTRRRPGLRCDVFKIRCMIHANEQARADNDHICTACIRRGGPAKQTARRHGAMNVDLRGLDIPRWKQPTYRQRVRGRKVA